MALSFLSSTILLQFNKHKYNLHLHEIEQGGSQYPTNWLTNVFVEITELSQWFCYLFNGALAVEPALKAWSDRRFKNHGLLIRLYPFWWRQLWAYLTMGDFENIKSKDKPGLNNANNKDNPSSGDYPESVVLETSATAAGSSSLWYLQPWLPAWCPWCLCLHLSAPKELISTIIDFVTLYSPY